MSQAAATEAIQTRGWRELPKFSDKMRKSANSTLPFPSSIPIEVTVFPDCVDVAEVGGECEEICECDFPVTRTVAIQ